MRLLSRVSDSQHGEIECNALYNAYHFETIASGATSTCCTRIFFEHVQKVFPNAVKKRSKSSTTVTTYKGISLNEISETDPIVFSSTSDQIHKLIPNDVKSVEIGKDKVKCSISTNCFRDGIPIDKTVTFYTDGHWTLELLGTVVDLDTLYMKNTYSASKGSVCNVLSAVRLLNICDGVKITNTVIMSRYHTLNKWKDGDEESRRLHSVVCSRLVSLASVSSVCKKCLKMTFHYPDSKKQNIEDDKENDKCCDPNETVSSNPDIHKQPCTKQDILNLFPGATDEMVEMLFSQAQNVNRDPKGRRWSESMISLCLQWYCRSPQSYEAVRSSGYLLLPSKSILIQYKSKVKQRVGFDDDIFLWMHEEAIRRDIPEDGYIGGLIIDEMAIQSDIQISKSGDVVELTGLMDIGDEGNMAHSIRKGKNEKVLGTHALQLLFSGISGFRFPVAHFISDGIQAPELNSIFWDAIDNLNMYGFKTLYTCMDGAQCNRTFMNINIGKQSKTYKVRSLCAPNDVVFMMDYSHVAKKIRNNILKSGISDKATRTLTLRSGSTVQWNMFIDCYHWDKSNALQLHRKLTNEHMFLSNQTKMRNHLAEEVLNTDMLHLMLQYQQYLGEKGSALNGAIELLKETSKLIQIFRDMRPIKASDDQRLQELLSVAQWFKEWETHAITNESVPKNQRLKAIMSQQCHEDIQSCVIGFVELCNLFLARKRSVFITPGLINSDIVENLFNQQRSTYSGANTNPNALQYRRTLNSILLGQNIVSQKANAGKNKTAASPYNFSVKNVKKRPATVSKPPEHDAIKVMRM